MHMDDLVSEAEEDIVSSEETSSEEAEDVKVCFICGDVGEEKKLAVCSRCNDGAVHTYCMRVMLQNIPESGWLCEECQAVVEIENKKLEKVQGNVVMISTENKVDAEHVAHKESNEDNQGNDIYIKRKEEDAGIIDNNSLDGGIHSLERCSNDVSSISKAKDVSNVAAWNKRLNKQSDAKNYEQVEDVKVCDICGDVGEEEKLAVCSRCNDGAEHVYCMQVMMEKVPEVMWLCEACQTEVEVAKERVKPLEGPANKSVNDANSVSSSEDQMEADNVGSKNSNMKHQPNVATKRMEGDARITLLIEKNLSEPEGVSIEDDSRERVTLSCKNSLKLGANKGKEPAGELPTSLALNGLKNKAPPLHGPLLKSISFNNSKVPKVKQLVIEVPPKPRNSEEPLFSLTKQEESMSPLPKSKPFKRPNSNKPANKGKSSLLLHAEEPRMMTSRMSQNVTNKRGTSMSGYPSVAASLLAPAPSKLEHAAQHLNKRNKVDSTAYVDCPELKYKEHQATSAMGRIYSDSSSTMLIDPTDKLPIFSPNDDGIASSFPELAYIWQGCFEVWRTGRSAELFEGLQVHVSCSASPKVVEIAKEFPSKILLEELPRQNLWPPHFHENGPSIGLFFFARDIRSYESHYSKLVENMLNDDLALRGNSGTAELLIFPSNILPKNFQRWNMFYYLWGVLRVRRKDPNLPPHVPTRPLEDQHHESIVASLSRNNCSAINENFTAPTRKEQVRRAQLSTMTTQRTSWMPTM